MARLRHFPLPWGTSVPSASTLVEPLKTWASAEREDWALWVRETAQNAWDAIADEERPVEVEYGWRELDARGLRALEAALEPAPTAANKGLVAGCRANPAIAWVRDSNTVGLGGPISPADPIPDGERTRWVDVVARHGRPPRHDLTAGGGTKGIGKNVNFLLSAESAVLIYTRTAERKGVLQSRLMVIAHGSTYTVEGRHYPGLHFWCEEVVDVKGFGPVTLPLTGEEADGLVADLGIRPFDETTTGTIFVVLAARDPAADTEWDGSDQADAESETRRARARAMGRGGVWAETIINSIRWNLWPKVLGLADASPEMQISVDTPGESFDADSVARIVEASPTVRHMKEALGAAMDIEDAARIPVEMAVSGGGTEHVGALGLFDFPVPPSGPGPEVERARVVTSGLSGAEGGLVALMRLPKLIVRYVEVAVTEGLLVRGAFIVDSKEMNDIFASYEKATHDNWERNYQGEREPGRHYRRHPPNTIDWIRNEVARRYPAAGGHGSSGGGSSVEEAYGRSMDAWASEGDQAGAGAPKPDGGTRGPRKRTLKGFRERGHEVLPDLEDGKAVHLYRVSFDPGPVSFGATLSLVLLGGGDPLPGHDPEFIRWEVVGTPGTSVEGSVLVLDENSPRDWQARFRVRQGTRAAISLKRV